MRLKLVFLTFAGPFPFLFLLPKLQTSKTPYQLTKLSYQKDGNLLLNEKNWKIKLNTKECKYWGQINYTEATKFVVKCQDHLNPDSKEFAFPIYARLYEDSINFWIELEKEEFNDNLVHFYNFFWSKKAKEELHNPIPNNCLFEGIYNNEHSLCLAGWKELNNLLKFVEKNKDYGLGKDIVFKP